MAVPVPAPMEEVGLLFDVETEREAEIGGGGGRRLCSFLFMLVALDVLNPSPWVLGSLEADPRPSPSPSPDPTLEDANVSLPPGLSLFLKPSLESEEGLDEAFLDPIF